MPNFSNPVSNGVYWVYNWGIINLSGKYFLMFRKKVVSGRQKDDRIRWRGHEVTRIEAFSDAVFAFAVTLLIVALEVPESSHEILESTKAFLPFGLCFILLFSIWYSQNLYFRRFALQDFWTIVLNGLLLFMVLLFVYPLKFIATAVFMHEKVHIVPSDMRPLFYVYSGGYTGIYLTFTLLYLNAMKQKHLLELDDEEAFETRTALFQSLGLTFVGVLSLIIAATSPDVNWAGFAFFIIGPYMAIFHRYRGRRHRILFEGKTGEVKD